MVPENFSWDVITNDILPFLTGNQIFSLVNTSPAIFGTKIQQMKQQSALHLDNPYGNVNYSLEKIPLMSGNIFWGMAQIVIYLLFLLHPVFLRKNIYSTFA